MNVEKKLQKLTYENRYGKPIYYKNYLSLINSGVITQPFPLEEKIFTQLQNKLNKNKYQIKANVKLNFNSDSYRIIDIAIYDKESKADTPIIALLVGIKAETSELNGKNRYIINKINDLLLNNICKVIWILPEDNKIIIEEIGKKIQITPLTSSIEILKNVKISLL